MTWFKVDDSFYDHPKVAGLTLSAVGLWTLCGNYCGRHLLDGHISDRQIRTATGGGKVSRYVQELVDAGLWHRCEDHPECVYFHEWEQAQPTRAEETQRKAAEAARKRRRRAEKRAENTPEQSAASVPPGDGTGPNRDRTGTELGSNSARTRLELGSIGNRAEPELSDATTSDQAVSENVPPDVRRPSSPARARRPDPSRPDKGHGARFAAASPDVPSPPQRQLSDRFDDGSPIPPEPAPEDDPGTALVPVPELVPAAVETGPRPARHFPPPAIYTLIRMHVPIRLPRTVMNQLAEIVQRLVNDPGVDRRDVETALAEWANRPGAGPKLLPNLVADAARFRATHARASGKPTSAAGSAAAAAEALAAEMGIS